MNICSLCDRALVAYILSQGIKAGTAANIFPAKRDERKVLPCTVCYSHSFKPCEAARYSGNFDVESFIEVRTKGLTDAFGPGARFDSDERVIATFNAFLTTPGDTSGEQIGELITRAGRALAASQAGETFANDDLAKFTVLNCMIVEGNQGFNSRIKIQQGNAWIDVLHLELTCCPSDVL